MSDQHDWVKRRERMVKCDRHGLHYDPEMSSGCLKCRREDAKNFKSSPQLVVLLLSLLGLAMVAFRIFGPSEVDPNENLLGLDPVALESESDLLPIDPLRVRIREVEEVLVGNQITTNDDFAVLAEDIAMSLATLRFAATEIMPAHLTKATTALLDLEQSFDPSSFDVESLARLRTEFDRWQRLFVEHDREPPAPPANDPSLVSVVAFRDAAQELGSILIDASDQLETLTSDPDADFAYEWREAANQQLQRIFDLQGNLPARPRLESRPLVAVGLQSLDGAFAEARSVLGSRGTSSSFDRAQQLASDAEAAFDQALFES